MGPTWPVALTKLNMGLFVPGPYSKWYTMPVWSTVYPMNQNSGFTGRSNGGLHSSSNEQRHKTEQ